MTDCSLVEIPVPFQPKLHKQWCLFDQADHIDFDTEVKKIEKKQQSLVDLRSETGDQDLFEDNDQRSPEKRAIDPLLLDIPRIQSVGGAHQDSQPRYKKKRHTENLEEAKHNAHVTANTKIVRMTKHVSHQ